MLSQTLPPHLKRSAPRFLSPSETMSYQFFASSVSWVGSDRDKHNPSVTPKVSRAACYQRHGVNFIAAVRRLNRTFEFVAALGDVLLELLKSLDRDKSGISDVCTSSGRSAAARTLSVEAGLRAALKNTARSQLAALQGDQSYSRSEALSRKSRNSRPLSIGR